MAVMGAQLKSMLSGDAAEPFNVELATDVARKSVAAEGDAVVGDVARRQIEQAVEVAILDRRRKPTCPPPPARYMPGAVPNGSTRPCPCGASSSSRSLPG